MRDKNGDVSLTLKGVADKVVKADSFVLKNYSLFFAEVLKKAKKVSLNVSDCNAFVAMLRFMYEGAFDLTELIEGNASSDTQSSVNWRKVAKKT